VKNRVLAIIVAALFLSVQAGTARADLFETSSVTTAATSVINTNTSEYGNAAAIPWPGLVDWSFNHSTSANGATVSTSVIVSYTGSSLTASGTGEASGASPTAGPASEFTLGFIAAVDAPYILTVNLAGDIYNGGETNTGIVFFVETSHSQYLLGPYTTPVSIVDQSGTLIAGDAYDFSIQAYPGQLDSTHGDWSFNLLVGSAASSVPEPGTMALLGCGLLGLAGLRRRKLLN